MPENFFTLPEVAEALSLNERTIRKYIAAGQLTAYKLGTGSRTSPIRIRQADLDAFLNSQRLRVS